MKVVADATIFIYISYMTSKLKDSHHKAWHTFISAHAATIDRINQRLIEAELLPLDWYDALLTLDKAPGKRLRMSDLARLVVLSRSGLTRFIDRLEKEGLIGRESCENDRRGTFAVLTQQGKRELQKTWPVYSEAIVEHFARYLSDSEAEILAEALTRVLYEGRDPNQVTLTGFKSS